MGGGAKKAFGAGGRFWRAVNKVVDPLNIMDPMGVLPTSMIAGKKPFQWDRNFGRLQWNLGGGGTEAPAGSRYDPMLMMYFSQMQAQQAQQARVAQEAQRQAMSEYQTQEANLAAQQAETDSQQNLIQSEGTQAAKDAIALEQQQKSYGSAGQSAVGDAYDINKSKQEQIYNASEIDSKKQPKTMKTANIFNMPRTSDIKFGGQ